MSSNTRSSLLSRTIAACVLVGSLVLATALMGGAPVDAQTADEPSARRLFVVGDSIVLGAKDEIAAGSPQGWTVAVDAKVSRTTDVGSDVVRANKGNITDVLVIGLGANDGGSPGVFRPRVEALLAEAAAVPHVFWLEIAEVREYYPGSNAVVRDVASRYDNVTVLRWSALSLGDPGLTADDGLHLTNRGQQAMADLVLATATATAKPAVEPGPDAEPGPDSGSEAFIDADPVEAPSVFVTPLSALIELLQTRASAMHSVVTSSHFR